MKRTLVGLLVLILVVGLVSPSLAARGGIKGRPLTAPRDRDGELSEPRPTQVETPPLGRALKKGWLKFELEGRLKPASVTDKTFVVLAKGGAKSLKRILEVKKLKGIEVTVWFTADTKFYKKGQPATKAALVDNVRVHVRGIIDKTKAVPFVAIRVTIKPKPIK